MLDPFYPAIPEIFTSFVGAQPAAFTYTLPTTTMYRQRVVIVYSAIGTANPITVNTGGGALWRILRNYGRLVLVALKDNPTVANDWYEESYTEEGTYTHSGVVVSGTPPGGSAIAQTGYYRRDGNRTSIHGAQIYNGAAGSGVTRLTVILPTFLRPNDYGSGVGYPGAIYGGYMTGTTGPWITCTGGTSFAAATGALLLDTNPAVAPVGWSYNGTFYQTYSS